MTLLGKKFNQKFANRHIGKFMNIPFIESACPSGPTMPYWKEEKSKNEINCT